MSKTLRAAIVGCGKIADAHVEQIRAIGGAEVVALCDAEPLMARQLGTRFGIDRQYADFRQMLDKERPDVVHIATPPGSHLALATEAIQAGAHVFVEKPFALDARAGQQIVDAAIAGQRKLAINYWYNFEPPALALQKMVSDGVLGDAVHVESALGYDLSGDFGAAVLSDEGHWVHRLPGKLFHNVLDHVVSKLTPFMLDAAPRVVTLDYRRRGAAGNPVLDAVADELRFLLGGAQVSAYGLISAQARPVAHSLRVYGTRNTINVDYRNRTVTLECEQRFPSALGRLGPPFTQARQYRRSGWRNIMQFCRSEFHYLEGMRRLLALFYDSIRTDGAPPIPYEQIMRVTRLIDLIIADLEQTRSAATLRTSAEAARP